MEPEKIENKVRKLLEEREIKPSAQSWKQLEQRMERREKGSKPYFLWVGAAAAIAVVFFSLGTYYNAPVPVETLQIVEQTTEEQILKEQASESQVQQVAVKEVKEPIPAERVNRKTIRETPIPEASVVAITEVTKAPLDAIEIETEQFPGLVEEIKSEIAAQNFSTEVSDHEIEALLLLASAELEANPVYSVNADDLLDQVEFELDQSFRHKVFEVVKEGLLKAKTAVANRDF